MFVLLFSLTEFLFIVYDPLVFNDTLGNFLIIPDKGIIGHKMDHDSRKCNSSNRAEDGIYFITECQLYMETKNKFLVRWGFRVKPGFPRIKADNGYSG